MSVFVYAATIHSITDAEFEQLRFGLPDFQQNRFNIKRPGSLFAWNLLTRAVNDVWNLDRLPQCIKPETGKPYFRDQSNMHFSLSHNDSFAICTVSHKPVGCDIESASRRPAKVLMDKVLTPDEYVQVYHSGEPEKTFMKLWTLKEAKLKKDGTGLAGGIGKTDMADILNGCRIRENSGEYYTVFEFEGNFVSVCGSDFAKGIIEIKI